MANGNLTLKIPPGLPDDVEDWDEDDDEVFLGENKTEYHLKEAHIQTIKDQEVCGMHLLDFEPRYLISGGMTLGGAYSICTLVRVLKVAKGLIAGPGK